MFCMLFSHACCARELHVGWEVKCQVDVIEAWTLKILGGSIIFFGNRSVYEREFLNIFLA